MQRISLALAVAMFVCSYGPMPLDARTIVLRAGWGETCAMLAQTEFRPNLQIQLKSNQRMKGHVSGTTAAGLTLERNGTATLIERTAIHSIRLVPRKPRGRRHRVLAIAGGVPAGLGAALASWYIGCSVAGGCDDPPHPAGSAGFYAVLVAVPVLLYRLAARADRGAFLIILDESVAHGSRTENPGRASSHPPCQGLPRRNASPRTIPPDDNSGRTSQMLAPRVTIRIVPSSVIPFRWCRVSP